MKNDTSMSKKQIVGERIRSLLKENNLSCIRLAKLSGVSESSIYRYEKGSCVPNRRNAGKIAKVLNVTTNYILGEDESIDQSVPSIHDRCGSISDLANPPFKFPFEKSPLGNLLSAHINDPMGVYQRYLENTAVSWMMVAPNLMKDKFDRKILKRMYQNLCARNPFSKKRSKISINACLPDSLNNVNHQNLLIQDCYGLPLKSKYAIVEICTHPTSFDIDFTDFFNAFTAFVPIMEILSGYPIMFLTRGYVSTDTFPEKLFYIDNCDKKRGKIKLPMKEILEKEHKALEKMGFISINEWTQFDTSEAFVWGNQIGLQLKDYITDQIQKKGE